MYWQLIYWWNCDVHKCTEITSKLNLFSEYLNLQTYSVYSSYKGSVKQNIC